MLLSAPIWAQEIQRQPLDLAPSVAGSFAEFRHHHLHSGVDLRTGGKEGFPVYAVADGWLRRMVIRPDGFGWALYIDHPSGYTSVYAHMSGFKDDWFREAMRQASARQQYKLDLHFKAGQFPIQAGDIIGHSGNSGGSSGPHLHFEWRDRKTEQPLNPVTFGLMCPDRYAPWIKGIFARQNGQWELIRKPKSGAIESTITIRGWEDLALDVYDYMEPKGRPLGLKYMEVYIDDVLINRFEVSRFHFSESRASDHLMHFEVHQQYGKRAVRLAPWKYGAKFWSQPYVDLSPGTHRVKIRAVDQGDNASTIAFPVMVQPQSQHAYSSAASAKSGTMSASWDGHNIKPDQKLVLSDGPQAQTWRANGHFPFTQAISYHWHKSAGWTYPARQTVLIITDYRGNRSRIAGKAVGGDKVQFRSKNWGHLNIIADTEAPQHKRTYHAEGFTCLVIEDEHMDTRILRVEVNGKWVWADYDAKSGTLKVPAQPQDGIKVVVEDECENRSTFTILPKLP